MDPPDSANMILNLVEYREPSPGEAEEYHQALKAIIPINFILIAFS
jgi:hypothetical protein